MISTQETQHLRATEVPILVHRRCNLNCVHCTTRAAPDADATDPADVRAAIENAAGAAQIVLTGGEPLLHPEIEALVRQSRAAAQRVVIETNGLLLATTGMAARLRDAGLSGVRVNLPSLDPEAYARVTQRPGVLGHALRGARAARAAGLGVAARVVIVPANVDGLAEFANALPAAVPGLSEVLFELPDLGLRATGVSRAELFVPYAALAPALIAAASALEARGIAARFAPSLGISPCSVPDATRAPALFTLRAGHRPGRGALGMAIEPCSECSAVNACEGFRRDHARLGAMPAAKGLKKRALTMLRDRDETARKDELIFVNVHDEASRRTVFLRVNYHCNQACAFCYVDRTLPNHERDVVLKAIESAATEGVAGRAVNMVFTGGEPTLNPHLAEYVERASALGARAAIQTNAVRLADEAIAAPLFAAGLREAFVSLHGATPAVGDAATEAPGTFVKTLAGIDRLVAAGIEVRLNFVMTPGNVPELPAFAALVASRWGTRVDVTFSLAVATGEASGLAAEVTPRMRVVEAPLEDALRTLHSLGKKPRWSTMGAGCTVPPCTLPDTALLDDAWDRPARIASDPNFVRAAACETCVLGASCPGVREEYASAFGTDELRPLRAPTG